MGCLLCLWPSNETRGQPQGPVFPPPAPDELEDEKSPKGQEEHPDHWRTQNGPGKPGGGGPGPCLRVSSQQGSRQQGLQSSHCGHCCKETQQEPRVPGTAGRRMLWTTAGQIHSHHYHKPCTKGLRLFARGLSVRGLSFPRRGISSSTQLLFGPGPRIGEHHVPAFTVLPHPETDPQSQGQYSRQGKQLLIQGWGTQHHQQGQGGAPL